MFNPWIKWRQNQRFIINAEVAYFSIAFDYR